MIFLIILNGLTSCLIYLITTPYLFIFYEPFGWERGTKPHPWSHQIPITYIIFLFLFQIIFAVVMFTVAIRRLKKEYSEEYRDRFKIIQMWFIIFSLVTKNIYCWLCLFRLQDMEFFHLPILALTSFFFYFFEVINNACWLAFIFHLKYMKSGLTNQTLAKVFREELTLGIIVLIIAILCILAWIGIMLASIIYGCHKSEIFAIDPQLFDPPQCESVNFAIRFYTIGLFSIGALAVMMKVVIGLLMLKLMKGNLYYPYIKVKKSVIFTIVATIVIISANAAYNFVNNFSFSIWIIFLLSLEKVSTQTLIMRAASTFLNSLFEVFLMCYIRISLPEGKVTSLCLRLISFLLQERPIFWWNRRISEFSSLIFPGDFSL